MGFHLAAALNLIMNRLFTRQIKKYAEIAIFLVESQYNIILVYTDVIMKFPCFAIKYGKAKLCSNSFLIYIITK